MSHPLVWLDAIKHSGRTVVMSESQRPGEGEGSLATGANRTRNPKPSRSVDVTTPVIRPQFAGGRECHLIVSGISIESKRCPAAIRNRYSGGHLHSSLHPELQLRRLDIPLRVEVPVQPVVWLCLKVGVDAGSPVH